MGGCDARDNLPPIVGVGLPVPDEQAQGQVLIQVHEKPVLALTDTPSVEKLPSVF